MARESHLCQRGILYEKQKENLEIRMLDSSHTIQLPFLVSRIIFNIRFPRQSPKLNSCIPRPWTHLGKGKSLLNRIGCIDCRGGQHSGPNSAANKLQDSCHIFPQNTYLLSIGNFTKSAAWWKIGLNASDQIPQIQKGLLKCFEQKPYALWKAWQVLLWWLKLLTPPPVS